MCACDFLRSIFVLTIVWLSMSLCEDSDVYEEHILFDGENGNIAYYPNQNDLVLTCQHSVRLTDALAPLNVTPSFESVAINECVPINTTYADELKALNINTTTMEWLVLIYSQHELLAPGNYTEGLKIKYMSIESVNNHNFLQNVENFFLPLSNLETLKVFGVEIPPLPESMRLVTLQMSNGGIKNWGNCRHLEHILLTHLKTADFAQWPKNCTRLKTLFITELLPETAEIVVERMIAAAPSLHTLRIISCRLSKLPIKMLQSAVNLVRLDLTDNALYDEIFLSFPLHNSLSTLILDTNLLRGSCIKYIVASLPRLRDLSMVYERSFESHPDSDIVECLQKSSVEMLHFDDNLIDLNTFSDNRFSKLTYMFINAPIQSTLKLLNLPKTNADHLEVNFGSHKFKKIQFEKEDYDTIQGENASSYISRNLKVVIQYVNCDCEHGWLRRALRDFPHVLSMPDLRCNSKKGMKILEELQDRLECNRTIHEGWIYRQSWRDGSVTAVCNRKAWVQMKPGFPLHGLNVSGQGISTLHKNMPKTIQWIDLRRNRISRASAEEVDALFAEGRQVWLANNSLLCDCDNRVLLDAIQKHQKQIKDYNLLKCVGTGEALSSISTSALCQIALIVSLSVCGFLILLAGVIATLLHWYGEQLRMFLYSRGLCMKCLYRKDLDDKPYDAFMSYAHEDQEYVLETLLPGLENAQEKFRICVHYRDWLVGDWIPAQIMRSVQLSKRTVILLSRNFVASPWSILEFRYAVANASEEPSAKVLILIKDDVLEIDLNMELKNYLTYNTYLRCDDPWFWEKLRYAMPHRVKNERTEDNIVMDVRREQLNVEN